MKEPQGSQILTPEDFISSFRDRLKVESEDRIWDHTPVDIQRFIEDPYYLNLKYSKETGTGCRQVVLDDLVHIFGTDPYRLAPLVREAMFSEAIGTGKSFRQSIIALYYTYKLLCLHNPLLHLNQHGCQLSPGSKIAIIIMSRTEDNAKGVIFSEINSKIVFSQWFNEFMMPNPKITSRLEFDAFPDNRNNLEAGKVYKNIHIIPGSSSEFSALGYNIICGEIDEITKFQAAQDRNLAGDSGERDQAEIVYSAIKARIINRFGDNGLIVCTGNPEHDQDFLEVHTERYANRSDVYTIKRRSIWASKNPEFNPEAVDKTGKNIYPHFYFSIPRQRIVDDNSKYIPGVIAVPERYRDIFNDTPEIGIRDYAGHPTSAVGRYITDPFIIESRTNNDRKNPLKEGSYPWPPDKYLESWFKREHIAWHGIHIDLGETSDAAAFTVTHPYGFTAKKEPLIYTDLFVALHGTPEGPVQIEHVMDWILYLNQTLGFSFGKITADKHQSVQLLQNLARYGFKTDFLSVDVDTKCYDSLVQTIRSGRNDYYFHPIALRELRDLERRGSKIDHPNSRNASKDISDSWAGSTFNSLLLASYDPPDDILKVGEQSSSAFIC